MKKYYIITKYRNYLETKYVYNWKYEYKMMLRYFRNHCDKEKILKHGVYKEKSGFDL